MGLIYIISISLLFLVFLLLREFWCWYYKINERNQLLKEVISELQELRRAIHGAAVKPVLPLGPAAVPEKKIDVQALKAHIKKKINREVIEMPRVTGNEWICYCGAHNPLDQKNCTDCHYNKEFVLGLVDDFQTA